MSRSRVSLLTLGLAFAACVGGPVLAVPSADPDYETVIPAPVALPTVNPPGLAGSPLTVSEKATGPRRRFVLRDGATLIGQVLAFDGQMYALRLAHGTVLVRKDLLTSIGPAIPLVPSHRLSRVAAGARS